MFLPCCWANAVMPGQIDRQLRDQGQARGERIDVVLLVELHHLLVQALLVVLVLRLQFLDVGRQALKRLHRLELLQGQRQQRRAHHDRQADDRQAPAAAHDVVVDEHQDRLEDVDERLEDVRVDERHHEVRGRKTRCCSTGSKPPWLHGLQRSRRQAASTRPRSMPNLRIACAAYSEQVGSYLQRRPSAGEISR
jgi:hypothetical protein